MTALDPPRAVPGCLLTTARLVTNDGHKAAVSVDVLKSGDELAPDLMAHVEHGRGLGLVKGGNFRDPYDSWRARQTITNAQIFRLPEGALNEG